MKTYRTKVLLFLLLITAGCYHEESCPDCIAPPPLRFSILDRSDHSDLIYAGYYVPDSIRIFYLKEGVPENIYFDVERDTLRQCGIISSLDLLSQSYLGIRLFYLQLESGDWDTLDLIVTASHDCCPVFSIEDFRINQQSLLLDSVKGIFLYFK